MRKIFLLYFIFIATLTNAQKSEQFKFTKITEVDLAKTVYPIDSSASAVVLGDIGSSEIVGTNKNWFGFEFTHHKRVHILKKAWLF